LLVIAIEERPFEHSSTKSTQCMKIRGRTGFETLNTAKSSDGMVRRRASHIIDARRYRTARSDGLGDRCCSRTKSRLRASAAIDEASRDATDMFSCCASKGEIYVSKRKNNRVPSTCIYY
jgi:hypothetical protein